MKLDVKSIFDNSFYITVNSERANQFDKIFKKLSDELEVKQPKRFTGFTISELTLVKRCALSHCAIIKMAYTLDLPYVLIFEDDAYPRDDIKESLLKCLDNEIPDTAKFLLLGHIASDLNKEKFDNLPFNSICNTENGNIKLWGAQAYLVFKTAYKSYLDLFEKSNCGYDADYYFHHTNLIKDTYFCYPNLFVQYNQSDSNDKVHHNAGWYYPYSKKFGINVIPEGFSEKYLK